MEKTLITAHSGCENTKIDSMDSIDLALEIGADAAEIDVRVDKTGELRISHDEVSAEEYQKKLTLRQVFEHVRGTDLMINCDLKEQAALYKTLEEAEKLRFPSDRLILSGCTSPEQLARDIRLFDRGYFYLNFEEVVKFVVLRKNADFTIEQFIQLMDDPWTFLRKEGMKTIGTYMNDTVGCYKLLKASAVNMPKSLLGSVVAQSFQKASLPLSIWTVNEPELMQECFAEKVLNVTTRQIRQAVQMRDDYYKGV